MLIDDLTSKTILEHEVFDYLFSIEDISKHNIALIDYEDKANQLKVKTKFTKVYNEIKKQKDREKRASIQATAQQRVTEFDTEKYPSLLCGSWQCNEQGIKIDYGQGTNIACYNPLMPVKRLENVETGTEKMVIAFKRDGYWREHIFDRDILSSSSRVASGLSRYGAIVTSETAKHLVKYLADIESLNSDVLLKQLSTSKLGWIKTDSGTHFMPYVDNSIVFDGQDKFKTLFDSITHKGSKKGYIAFLKKVRQSHRVEPKLALIASLSSVLVEMCGTLPFILHLYGEGGKGKTLCMMLAASVWANPNEGGYIADPKSTPTAFEMRLNVLNHLPFICDDMGSIKKKFSTIKGADFSEFIYLVCNGRGNERSNVNLGLNYVPNWKNCSITSSEKPLTSETSQGGELLRTIEIETEPGNIFNDGKSCADFMRNNYGFIGRIWVDIINDLGKDKILEIYNEFKKRIEEKDVNKEKEGKQIGSITALLTADKILDDYLLHDNNCLDFDYMFNLIRSNNQMSDNERAYEWIKSEVEVNISKFKTNIHGDEPAQRWGYIEGGWTWLNSNIFNELCEKGNFDRKLFINWACANDKASRDNGKLTKKKRMPNGKTSNFICLNLDDETHDLEIEGLPNG